MRSGRGPSLEERSAASGLGAPREAATERTRHCWVAHPDGSGRSCPGLVVEWRRLPAGGWQALTVYVVADSDGAVLVQAWLAAGLLRPG